MTGAGRGDLDRPRRSVLWVPGDQPRKLERSAACGADVVVLDLEDAVPADRKAVARETVSAVLRDLDFGHSERLVRVVNGPELEADVEAAAGADGLCMPKVDGPADLARVRAASERAFGFMLPVLAISGETATGVLGAERLIDAEGVVAWMWGSEDLAAALGCHARGPDEPFVEPLQQARSSVALLAAATGAQAIDTVYPFFRDHAGLVAEAADAAAVGFVGKGLIHPDQVQPVNEVFTPSDVEIERAQAVIAAFADSVGVATLDGQMLDLPHFRAARSVLARAGAFL